MLYNLSKTFGVFILRKCNVKNHNEIREISNFDEFVINHCLC